MPLDERFGATTQDNDTSQNHDASHEPRDTADRQEADNKLDLRSQLRAAADEHRSPRQEAASRRDRDQENGQFRPKQEIKPPGEGERDSKHAFPREADNKNSQEGKPPEASTEPTPDKAQAGNAPEALTKEIRAIWHTLPENVRNEFVRREADSQKGVQQLKERYRPIDEALAPYTPTLQQMGHTPAAAIKQLLGWQAALSGPNKVEAAQALLKSHGIALPTHTAAPPGAAATDDRQPQTTQNLPPELQSLSTKFDGLESQFQRREQQAQRQEAEQTSQRIAAFAKDNPHFERVRVTMGNLIQAGLATDLDEAYAKAVYMDPETRAQIQEEETAKRDAAAAEERQRADAAKAEDEQKRKAAEDKARRAGVSPKGSSPTGPVSSHRRSGKSVGSDIRDAIRDSRGSV